MASYLQRVALELLAVREVVLVALEGKELERAGRDLELRGARGAFNEWRVGGGRESRRRGAARCDGECAARRRRGARRTIFKKNATPASCRPKALTSSHEFVTSDTFSEVTIGACGGGGGGEETERRHSSQRADTGWYPLVDYNLESGAMNTSWSGV